jgi:hypothetical protein
MILSAVPCDNAWEMAFPRLPALKLCVVLVSDHFKRSVDVFKWIPGLRYIPPGMTNAVLVIEGNHASDDYPESIGSTAGQS